ncbi:N-acetylmuramoyl-L-alanine amidase [Streptomyces zingiberis]|uniref:N-acetylmuramoyl-L-alanine amidase n=1 Tax=Streptomyces zingiberis TaxID=2053010 RepID=A0ABX1BZ34_9ACTN|nr:nucleoside transporter [Streptomyces zingiberis]
MHPGSPRRPGRHVLLGTAVATVLTLTVPAGATASPATPNTHGPVNEAFSRAADEFGVPRDLLVALAYAETRLDGHDGEPSHAGGYGVMHLVGDARGHTLERASELTGTPEEELRTDDAANIRGGAAVLDSYADEAGLGEERRHRAAAWYPAVARYGGAQPGTGARFYADTVYQILAEGVRARTPDGEAVVTPGQEVRPERGPYAGTPGPGPEGVPGEEPADKARRAPVTARDYPSARWVPADPANYRKGRTARIDTVVVHVAQGTYEGTVSWFRDPSSQVSAHYVVRSSDGAVTQSVRDADTAYHARQANARSLGIEHEGWINDAKWFTDVMYRSSAALTAYLCETHGIPKDRAHIVGHGEVPGNDHTDPGPYWDWKRYMELVQRA